MTNKATFTLVVEFDLDGDYSTSPNDVVEYAGEIKEHAYGYGRIVKATIEGLPTTMEIK